MDKKGVAGKLPANYSDVPVKACATQAGLSWSPIAACFAGAEGDALVAATRNITLSTFGHAEYGVPTVMVDGKQACGINAICNFNNIAKLLPGHHNDDTPTNDMPPSWT
mmetsp:Transcript_20306/g.71817  ORF Transcript_20306/g.71817 Transcript_20306/m.71817 type:complete len:109 (+) Transcript_20306:407-733(+)